MTERVTAHMVAERAGVSQSAVSRVFTPGASASPKTVTKVRKAANELGYRPNVLARAMVSGRSRMIGLIVPYLENHFFPDVLERLSKALQTQGYHVLVFMASNSPREIDQVIEEIMSYQVDGIIMASVAMSSDIALRCQAQGIPVVLFNRSQDLEGITWVTSDNRAGAKRVAEFLLAGGHQRIGYLAGWEGASTQRDREAGFREGLAAAGREIDLLDVGDYNTERTIAAVRRMFDRPRADQPDALFCATDHMALIAMDILRYKLDLRVPEDVSVVGYDDAPTASWLAYNLTTVRQRVNLMVEETVRVLLDAIDTPEAAKPKHVTMDAPLILRKSARVPKGWTT